ncbi:S-adenosyl-L-methionine-dependent methyltransferase [Tirmania nivea]|nr:S-adenosyl-L-methionine-dependent methyltransferase [Tirmania nivea]
MDFADMHPESEVVGNDISPIQPSWAPSNLTFELDDVEEAWMHPEGHFDYIHMRSLSGNIAGGRISLAPRGWIEFQDYGCDLPNDQIPAVGRWFVSCEAAAVKFGRRLTIAKDMEKFFKEAGFVDVRVWKEIWPLSAWPKDKTLKEIGKWALLGCIDTAFPSAIMLLTKLEGWMEHEVRRLCDDAIEELTKRKQRFYGKAWFILGRRPEKDKET